MRNAEHQDIGHVLLAYDITQQLEAQRELHAARRTAESANVSKTAFLATMSHEIRTPMTAILGYIELLEDAGPRCTCSANAELIGHLRTISRNARHLLSVVDNILDLSKIEAGRLQIAHARCNPAEMLSDLHDLFSSQAARDGIDFSVTAATPLPEFILSDATRLRQILFNLVSNAFKFTATGSIRVSAAYWPAEAPTLRPRFEIEIADTGAGMNSVQLARLFERFSHSSEARQRAQHGSGLGLALSRELARALGGDLVLVETAPGIGTRMRVTLDPGIMSDIATAEVQLPLVPSARKPGPAPEHADNSLAGRRILVVDDGPDNQRLLGYFLRRAGASTYFASNGAEAVEQVQAATPSFDAIVMDIQMPVLDGRDATRKLREHGCDIPILACSAHGCDGERDLCTAAGCDDYMPKPVVRGALVERIVKLLAEHASRKTATHST
jgi:signal transduction histidine kinase/ActR/RegA family two-component response regulator